MREFHEQKKAEIHEKEIDLCMEKLNEIESRVERGVQNMNEKIQERVTYLKTQGLECKAVVVTVVVHLKKEQAKKMQEIEEERKQKELFKRQQLIDKNREKAQKEREKIAQ